MKQTVNITCPVCQTETQSEIVTRIDAQAQPELKKQLLEGTLFTFECDTCGAQRQIDSDLLYIDQEKQLVVSLIPNLEDRKEEMEGILTQFIRQSDLPLNKYVMRVVRTAPTLVEKVSIIEEGYNDIVVEIVKLLTDGLFAKERPDEHVRARYFYRHNGQAKLLYITDNDQLIVDFHESLVKFAEDKYNKAITEDYKGRFIVVDQNWAANLLEHKAGDAVEEFESQQETKPLSKSDQQRIQKKLKQKRRH